VKLMVGSREDILAEVMTSVDMVVRTISLVWPPSLAVTMP